MKWIEVENLKSIYSSGYMGVINVRDSGQVYLAKYNVDKLCFALDFDTYGFSVPFEATHYFELPSIDSSSTYLHQIEKELEMQWQKASKYLPYKSTLVCIVNYIDKNNKVSLVTYNAHKEAFFGFQDFKEENPVPVTHWIEVPICSCRLGLTRWYAYYNFRIANESPKENNGMD